MAIDRLKGNINVPPVQKLDSRLGAGPGRAVAEGGAAIMRTGQQIVSAAAQANEQFFKKAAKARQNADFSNGYNKTILEYTRRASPLMANPIDDDGSPLLDRLPDKLGEIGQEVLSDTLNGIGDFETKDRLRQSFNNFLTQQQLSSFTVARNQQIDYTRKSVSDTIDTLSTAAVTDNFNNINQYDNTVNELLAESGGAFSSEEQASMLEKYKNSTRMQVFRNIMSQDPQSAKEILGANDPESLGLRPDLHEALQLEADAALRDQRQQALQAKLDQERQMQDAQTELVGKLETGIVLGQVGEKDVLEQKENLPEEKVKDLVRKTKKQARKKEATVSTFTQISNDVANGEFLRGKYTPKQISQHYLTVVQRMQEANGKPLGMETKAGIVRQYQGEVTAFTSEIENSLFSGTPQQAADSARALQFLKETGSHFTSQGMEGKYKAINAALLPLLNNVNVNNAKAVEFAREAVIGAKSDARAERQAEYVKIPEFKADKGLRESINDVIEKSNSELEMELTRLQPGLTAAVEFFLKEGYVLTGTVEGAQEYASSFLQGIVGESRMDGVPVTMIYPPELILGGESSEIQKFMAEQLEISKAVNAPRTEDGNIDFQKIRLDNAGIDTRNSDGQFQYLLYNTETGEVIQTENFEMMYIADPDEFKEWSIENAKLEEQIERQRLTSQGPKEPVLELGTVFDAPRKFGRVKPEVRSSLEEASQVTGVDIGDLFAIAKVESALKPNARARTSSAGGLFQFIDSTWAGMVRKYGPQYGITLGDKMNPRANAIMGALFTRDNAIALKNSLGREPNLREMYLAHFSGVGKALKVLKMLESNPNAHVSSVYSAKEIRANRGILKGSLKSSFNRLTDKVVKARK